MTGSTKLTLRARDGDAFDVSQAIKQPPPNPPLEKRGGSLSFNPPLEKKGGRVSVCWLVDVAKLG